MTILHLVDPQVAPACLGMARPRGEGDDIIISWDPGGTV